MIAGVALLAALTLQVAPASHVVVPAGDRLEVTLNTRGGDIVVEAEERTDIEVIGQHSEEIRLVVNPGRTVEVREGRPPRATLERTEYLIRVPRSMPVKVVSLDAAVVVRGVQADVSVVINHGSARAIGVSGAISLDSSTGDLTLESSRGSAHLDTSPGTVVVRGFDGPIEAEAVGGTVSMTDVSSASVRVTTNAGSISFQGELTADGVLDVATHRGDVDLSLPASTSAVFEVGTVSGQLDIGFDLTGVTPVRGETFTFTTGTGNARIAVITYTGAVRIGPIEPA